MLRPTDYFENTDVVPTQANIVVRSHRFKYTFISGLLAKIKNENFAAFSGQIMPQKKTIMWQIVDFSPLI